MIGASKCSRCKVGSTAKWIPQPHSTVPSTAVTPPTEAATHQPTASTCEDQYPTTTCQNMKAQLDEQAGSCFDTDMSVFAEKYRGKVLADGCCATCSPGTPSATETPTSSPTEAATHQPTASTCEDLHASCPQLKAQLDGVDGSCFTTDLGSLNAALSGKYLNDECCATCSSASSTAVPTTTCKDEYPTCPQLKAQLDDADGSCFTTDLGELNTALRGQKLVDHCCASCGGGTPHRLLFGATVTTQHTNRPTPPPTPRVTYGVGTECTECAVSRYDDDGDATTGGVLGCIGSCVPLWSGEARIQNDFICNTH